MDKSLLIKIAKIADNLDNLGLYQEADEVTRVLRLSAKNDEDDLSGKILKLFEKEDVTCPECGGKMDMEDGLCNCGDEDCDCTIDMKDEIEDFLRRIDIGNIDCPECGDGTLMLKGMHCICKNGKCNCKQKVTKTLLSDIFDNKKFDKKFSNSRTASYDDHEFSMARKQLMSAHDAIDNIIEKLGDDEGNIMAWTQAYITMASDYLQSVENYFLHGEDFGDNEDLDDDDDSEEFDDSTTVDDEGYVHHHHHDDDTRTASTKNEGKRLNKPFRTPGGPKKFSVYVKNKKGNVVKVNFGDPKRSIKRDNPNRRKNFRARHNCDSDPRAKDRTTAKYWSCKFWSNPSVSSLLKG
jgi:hypothetical protein